MMNLQSFFQANPRAAVAFSGGVDSAYLLWAAKASGAKVWAYYVKSPFQPLFELTDAVKLCRALAVPLTVLPVDVLSDEAIAKNDHLRCYSCKRRIFTAILEAAKRDGFDLLLDGTNASDEASDRPGMRALSELHVLSPLRLCGLTKAEIRQKSRDAGLFTWDKPAYACLATRVPTREAITPETLRKVEAAEEALFSLGYSDLRVRVFHGAARLQLPGQQLEQAAKEREAILQALAPWFDTVLLDLKER